jgi:hypothetical protein
MNTPTQIESTPAIHRNDIQSSRYLGEMEIGEDVWSFVLISHGGVKYVVAGGVCNAGLIPSYAMEMEFTEDEALQDIAADLADLDYPSGGLLAWHGSLVI